MHGDVQAPRRARETVRASLRAELRRTHVALTALELSGLVGVPHKEVDEHLEHLRSAAAAHGERLVVTPARCVVCAFEFRTRERSSRPSRCPACKSERITPPGFSIVER